MQSAVYSQVGQIRVEYLGHVISYQGVAMDPAKVFSVLNWPIPKTLKGVPGFLGLTFIKGYASIARSLNHLLKKEHKWRLRLTQTTQEVFQTLKQVLVTAPVLATPDFNKTFVVECDASRIGLGVVLMQERRPITYFSKCFSQKFI